MPKFTDLNEVSVLLVLECLDAVDLLRVSVTSKSLFASSSEDRLWKTSVDRFRSQYCPLSTAYNIKEMNPDNSCTRLTARARSQKNAYWVERYESNRSILTVDDLCIPDRWCFRFKEEAGSDWQDICPWHRGGTAATLAFRRYGPKWGRIERLESPGVALPLDGVVLEWFLQWQPNSDPGAALRLHEESPNAEGDDTICTEEQQAMMASLRRHRASLNRSAAAPLNFQRDRVRTDNNDAQPSSSSNISANTSGNTSNVSDSNNDSLDHSASTSSSPMLRRSQRIKQTVGDGKGDGDDGGVGDAQSLRQLYLSSGNCVRLRVNQVLVPTYLLTTPRVPALRGHFLLESCWGVYASFELPLRGHCAALEDGALKVSSKKQWREIRAYNQDILTMTSISDDDDDGDDDVGAIEDGGEVGAEDDAAGDGAA